MASSSRVWVWIGGSSPARTRHSTTAQSPPDCSPASLSSALVPAPWVTVRPAPGPERTGSLRDTVLLLSSGTARTGGKLVHASRAGGMSARTVEGPGSITDSLSGMGQHVDQLRPRVEQLVQLRIRDLFDHARSPRRLSSPASGRISGLRERSEGGKELPRLSDEES